MKFSVVTISFNQAEFLERTMKSVFDQTGVDVEYIVVDPGSTDGSRNFILSHADRLAHTVFEPDDGPADGLNKGFSHATGDIYCYLNSDDTFEPDALKRVAAYFNTHPDVDVVMGHALIIDHHDRRLRRTWSEPFRPLMVAYGASTQIQPSTFIRREAFIRSGGFKVANRSNWDGELLVDLSQTGARFGIIDAFLSCYRLHPVSITSSGKLNEKILAFSRHRFERIMGRPYGRNDRYISRVLRMVNHLMHPKALLERLRFGPIYRRSVQ
ncbi:glycosyltransferase involved in cell wall biosynthesis [Neorhizobium galegae]|uniref:glycosyltransferase family 2 protein n=1 Tax=Neorhizobium galegae TaxID=399 RepID=UPI001AE5E3B5|nr:glycosyltransferase family 2 protein [Neorhizobium galegae]MBP2550529.1 glycosyltransferase involved in cell wall biosynthesis [Neorhizobium galegae]